MFELTLPDPLIRLTSSCEVYCVAGCCGLDAFEVKSDHILSWLAENDVASATTALDQLEALSHAVLQKGGQVTSGMNDFSHHWSDSSACVDYLELWQREAVSALLTHVGGMFYQAWWMEANGQAARSLARAIEETGDFSQLPVLGDALEEAGCPAATLLEHCRAAGPHARRCWVVDLLLAADGQQGPMPSRTTPPRRNRVTPFGDVIAASARGTLMGNRGKLHDDHGRIQKTYVGQRWLLCLLSFRDRRRTVMAPGRYTELFFLDEATGLAAGHRPCAECQRERFTAFRRACGLDDAGAIDRALDAERQPPGMNHPVWESPLDELPPGVMALLPGQGTRRWGDQPHLIQTGRRLLPWRLGGYEPAINPPAGVRVAVLTPRTTVSAIRAGYVVGVHPTGL